MIKEYILKVTNKVLPNAFSLFETEYPSAQELIRCKDCVHWIPGTITGKAEYILPRCKRNGGVWLSDEYCSNAERREQDA